MKCDSKVLSSNLCFLRVSAKRHNNPSCQELLPVGDLFAEPRARGPQVVLSYSHDLLSLLRTMKAKYDTSDLQRAGELCGFRGAKLSC